MESLPMDQIRIDGGTQSRAKLYQDVVLSYAEQIEDGAQFPPITVFYDGAGYWMADGFHRYAARRQLGCAYVTCDVRQGDRLSAIKHSLAANDTHGIQRTPADYARAYQCAIDNNLCAPDDTAGVQKLLRCTPRHAQRLTKDVRESAKAERDRKIETLASEGKTQREIAREVGCDQKTVSNRLEEKRTLSEIPQAPTPEPEQEASDGEPVSTPAAQKAKPAESRPDEEGGCLSAWVLSARAVSAIQRIDRSDPSALAAIESIRDAITKQLSIITA